MRLRSWPTVSGMRTVRVPHTYQVSCRVRFADGTERAHTVEAEGHNIGDAMDNAPPGVVEKLDPTASEDATELHISVRRISA
jgi:hypothetical protein